MTEVIHMEVPDLHCKGIIENAKEISKTITHILKQEEFHIQDLQYVRKKARDIVFYMSREE